MIPKEVTEEPELKALIAEEVAKLHDWFGEEDLHPDLEPWVEEEGTFGPILRHPLVYSLFYAPPLNKSINQQYTHKLEALAEYEAEGNWSGYVFIHERPYRVTAFTAIEGNLEDAEYWELLARIWTDSENIRQNPEVWEGFLRSERPAREQMMNAEERAVLDGMADEFTVYQGHTTARDDGWSWTLNLKTAEWFARRFAELEDSKPVVTTAKVFKADVTAYLNRRNESEIIVDPALLRDRSSTTGVKP